MGLILSNIVLYSQKIDSTLAADPAINFISARFTSAANTAFLVTVKSASGDVESGGATFTKMSNTPAGIFSSPDASKLGVPSSDSLYQGQLEMGGKNTNYIISANKTTNSITGIYGYVCYQLNPQNTKEIMLADPNKLSSGCPQGTSAGWVRLDQTHYKYPLAVTLSTEIHDDTAQSYFFNTLKSGTSYQKTFAQLLNGDLTMSGYTGKILAYQDLGANATQEQLEGRIGNQLCIIVGQMRDLYQNDIYWKNNKPATLSVFYDSVIKGSWSAFEFTVEGQQKLNEIQSQMDTLNQYVDALKTKTGGKDPLKISWCKFSESAPNGTITKWGKTDGSEVDTLYWVLNRLNVVKTHLQDQPTEYVASECQESCKVDFGFLKEGYCAFLCIISETLDNIVTFSVKLLIAAAGVS